MLLMGVPGESRIVPGSVDDRLVGWQDIMPTLLDLAGIDPPPGMDGCSMVADSRRSHLYGECNEGPTATRMIRESRFKLIYYPAGTRRQLFDLESDPTELRDLASVPEYGEPLERLTSLLIRELYGGDLEWLDGPSNGRRVSSCTRVIGATGQGLDGLCTAAMWPFSTGGIWRWNLAVGCSKRNPAPEGAGPPMQPGRNRALPVGFESPLLR